MGYGGKYLLMGLLLGLLLILFLFANVKYKRRKEKGFQ